MTSRVRKGHVLAFVGSVLLAACGGDYHAPPVPPPAAFTVGGGITGLSASGLVLANGGDVLPVVAAATGFTLPTAVAQGSTYAVTVQTQPAGEQCSISGASGTISGANVTNVAVACAADAHSLGGTITGLASSGLVLANGADNASPASGATSFTFTALVAEGGAFAVSVKTQPSGQTCSVGSGSGTMGAADNSSVAVTCSANSYTLGGTISGLTAAGLILANGTDTLSPVANAATFTFAQSVAFDGSYSVTVQQQPAGQTCAVAGAFPATMGAGNVTSIAVSCAAASGLTIFAGQAKCPSPANVDGTGAAASLPDIEAMAFDRAGNLFATGGGSKTVRKITPAGVVSTLAGQYGIGGSADGTGLQATFGFPLGIGIDSSGNLYVSDDLDIRAVTQSGVVTTLAGRAANGVGFVDGTGPAALFHAVRGMTTDSAGNAYIADTGNFVIRKMTPAGVVTTFAGGGSPGGNASGFADGTGTAALFAGPVDVAIDAAGNLYVADENNSAVRMITPSGVVTTLAGGPANPGFADGTGTAALLSLPSRVTIGPAGNLYVLDQNSGGAIRVISGTGVVTTLAKAVSVKPTGPISAPSVVLPDPGSNGVFTMATDASGALYLSAGCSILKVGP
jgi:hypothetical protein